MTVKKRFTTDHLLLGIAGLGLLLTGLYFFQSQPMPVSLQRRAETDQSLGFVRANGRDVRLRSKDEMSWSQIRSDTDVFQQDRLYTGADSSATVRLKSNQELFIEPNSLILINSDEQNAPIDLEKGGLFGRLQKGMTLFVRTKNETTAIQGDGTDIRVEAPKRGPTRIVVMKGEANVRHGKATTPVKVTAHQQVSLAENKVQVADLDVRLLKPDSGSILWSRNDSVDFHWTTRSESNLVLEVATEPSFARPMVRQAVTGQSSRHALPHGRDYFWRLVPTEGPTDNIPVSSFSLMPLRAPVVARQSQVVTPTDGNGNAVNSIEFAWNDPSVSESYRLDLASDESFSKLLFTDETPKRRLGIRHMKPGAYFWRVSSIHPERETLTSEIGRIDIVDKTGPQPPPEAPPLPVQRQLAQAPAPTPPPPPPPLSSASLSPQERIVELTEPGFDGPPAPAPIQSASHVALDWTPVEGATSYEVQISSFDDFRQALKTPTDTPSWTWNRASPGQYHVRVLSRREQEVSVSNPLRLRVLLAPPTPSNPRLAAGPDAAPLAQLTWKAHSQTAHTEIQIAGDKNFTQPRVVRSQSNRLEVPVPEGATSYFRWRSLNKNGWPVSRFSETRILAVPPRALKVRQLASAPAKPTPVAQKEEAPNLVAQVPKLETLKAPVDGLRLRLWSGLGANHLMFAQKGAEDVESGTFSQTGGPNLMLGIDAALTKRTRLRVDYHDLPGQVETAAGTAIDQNTYRWKTLNTEVQYRLGEYRGGVYSLMMGLQTHQVPLLSVDDFGTGQLLQSELQNLSFGARTVYPGAGNVEYEAFLRTQTLMGSKSLNGDDFRANSKLMFDGSLGVTRKFSDRLRMGVFWFGQYQDLNYEFTRDGTTNSGSQTFFNSNLQFRLGYDFLALTLLPMGRRRRREDEDKDLGK